MQEKLKPFSTQATILQQLNVQNSNGLCSPLTNLYANYKMGKGTRDFLDGGPAKTYEYAKEMEKHQSAVTQEVTQTTGNNSFGSLMGMHVAFFDNRKKFQGERRSVEQLSTTDGAKEILKNAEHVLVNYPTNGAQQKTVPYHQVYYGHTLGTNKCSYFNANLPGGEQLGSCDDLLNAFVKDIKNSAAHDGRDCIIGRSMP